MRSKQAVGGAGAVAGVLAALLVTGCGSDRPGAASGGAAPGSAQQNGTAPDGGRQTPKGPPTDPATPPPADVTTPPPLSQIPPPTLTRPKRPPNGPSDLIKPINVRGTVVVEPTTGCLQLAVGTDRWVLVGAQTRTLREGEKIVVDGMPAPQLRGPCDGTVLQIRSLKRQ